VVLDEQELRDRLAATADQADPPSFTAERLIPRIRRRRARVLGLAAGSLLAAAAIGVAVPVALSASPAPSTTVAQPPNVSLQLSFTVTVNGQSRTVPAGGPVPRFTVAPGERLSVRISVTARPQARVTALWLGVADDGVSSPGADGRQPAGLRPVFAHAGRLPAPGERTFAATWTVPAQAAGATLWLAASWDQPDAGIGRPIAELVTQR
jgi:hypothetical protein